MDFTDILKDISLLSYAGSMIKWVLGFALVGIVLIVLGHRFKLFKRNKKVPNILAKFYYVLIPLYFIFFAFKFAPIRNTQNELNRVIHKHEPIVKKYTYDFMRMVISDSSLSNKTSVKSIVNHYIEEVVEEQSKEAASKMGFGAKFLSKWDKKIKTRFLESILEKKLIEKTTGAVGLQSETGEALYEHSFSKLFKDGEVVDLIIAEINGIFSKAYTSMFIFMGFILLIPVMEIVAAKFFKY